MALGIRRLLTRSILANLVRLGESGLDLVLLADMPVVAKIARGLWPDGRRATLRCLGDRDEGGKLFIINRDQLGRVARLGAGFGDDHDHGVADMAHSVRSQRSVRRLGHGAAVLVLDAPAAGQAADIVLRHVGAGEHGDHAGGFCRPGGIELADLRMGMRRAQDMGIELARAIDVVDVGAAAGEKAEVFLAAHGGADAVLAHGDTSL